MSKLNKKGRNPNGGPLDCWLDSLGYYRKNVAYDETCLFRAVSEQLFVCQLFHEKVRSECIEYAKTNSDEFSHIETNEKRWLERLDKLSKHMIICGDAEISIISRKYKKNIVLFNEYELSMTEIKFHDANGTLYLCFMGEDHYDVVYKKEYISNAGFCQSIVYGIVYESVFHMSQVSEIVDHMLNEKPSNLQITDDLIQRMKQAEEIGVLINNNDQQQITFESPTSKSLSFDDWTDLNANLPSTSKAAPSAKYWVESKVQTQRLQLQLGLTTPQQEKPVQLKHLFNSKPLNQDLSIEIPTTSLSFSTTEDVVNGASNMVRAGGCWLYTGTSLSDVSGLANGDSSGEGVVHPLTDFEMMICGKIAPFPYKVAKALDPHIYRNIEYDTWSEMRKEMRLCNWYYGDNNFKEGTCCRVEINGSTYPCYIQTINGDKCDVFVTHSAERKTVEMNELLPEEDAKPWPIPYRFTKNAQPANASAFSNHIMDTYKRNRRRSRDKKRTTSNGSSNPGSQDDHSTVIQTNPYEGCPLVQQRPHQQPIPTLSLIDMSVPPPPITTHSPTPPVATLPPPPIPLSIASPTTCASQSTTSLLAQQQQATNCQTAASDASSLVVWDTSYWENAMPPPTPENAQITQWVPVTNGGWDQEQIMSPGVVGMYTYGHLESNYYYNNSDGSYTNVWTEYPTVVPVTTQNGNVENMPYMVAAPTPAFVQPMSPQVMEQPLYHQPHPPTPVIHTPYPCTPPGTPILYAAPPPSPYLDTPSTPTSRPTPHQLFLPPLNHLSSPSPLISTVGPFTPVTPTTNNIAMLYHHQPVLSPGAEMQHQQPFIQAIPTPTYMYPTTPTWYPPGINAHGFIFPTPQQGGNVSGAVGTTTAV